MSARKRVLLAYTQTHTQRAIETFLNGICNERVSLRIHNTNSLLSSASLFGNYIRNWHIRNNELNNSSTVRRLLQFAAKKNAMWEYRIDQQLKRQQLEQALQQMQLEERALSIQSRFKEGLEERLERMQDDIQRLQTALQVMIVPEVHSNGHPMVDEDEPEGDGHPGRIRGFMIRVAGPKLGTKRVIHKAAVGAISINSVDYVTHDEAKVQIPGRSGIYGLTVRVVYGMQRDRPGFQSIFWDGTHHYQPFREA